VKIGRISDPPKGTVSGSGRAASFILWHEVDDDVLVIDMREMVRQL
jgi:hypothetical protein